MGTGAWARRDFESNVSTRKNNEFIEFNIVSLERLAELGETTINPDVLRKAGVIKTKHPVKILGDGELSVALTVSAHKFSKSAQEKITKAGGKVEVLQ